MSKQKLQMREDRALRDAAKALVEADIAFIRARVGGGSLTKSIAQSAGDSAKEVFESAANAADNNKGILAAIVGAMILWFARNPILSLFEEEIAEDNVGTGQPHAEPEGPPSADQL